MPNVAQNVYVKYHFDLIAGTKMKSKINEFLDKLSAMELSDPIEKQLGVASEPSVWYNEKFIPNDNYVPKDFEGVQSEPEPSTIQRDKQLADMKRCNLIQKNFYLIYGHTESLERKRKRSFNTNRQSIKRRKCAIEVEGAYMNHCHQSNNLQSDLGYEADDEHIEQK